MTEHPDVPTNPAAPDEVPPKVTGIGGIFFFADNPAATRQWYARHLGFEVNEWGATFESGSAERPEETTTLQWSPFPTGSDYFAPSPKPFMINYRVQNLAGLVRRLREGGVTILDDIARHDYGQFVHILDPEGNEIELWEPN